MRSFALLLAGLLVCSPAQPATFADFNPWFWSYTYPAKDLTVEAVQGTEADFDGWRAQFASDYAAIINGVPISAPSPAVLGSIQQRTGYTLQEINFPFPSGPTIPTLIAKPTTIDPNKPIIIAQHGHEMSPQGGAPYALFAPDAWAEKWVKAGYVVWAPSSVWHTQLGSLPATYGYQRTWVRMTDRLMTAALPHMPEHNRFVATGLSSGAQTMSFLMALRSDIDLGVFAGSFFPLEYARENYRISGHPNDYDMPQVFDYTPIYALMASRSVQWQIGKQDGFYPRLTPGAAAQPSFPGTPRPVSTTEMLGQLFVTQKVFEKKGGTADLFIHDGGHLYDFAAAKAFVEAQ